MNGPPFRESPLPPAGSAGGAGVPGAAADPALAWDRNPWRDDRARAMTGVAVLLGLVFLLAGLARPIGAPPATLAVLLLLVGHSLAPSWWTCRYRVDAEGVAAREPFVWRRIPWSAIRRAVIVAPRAGSAAAVPPGERLFVSTLPHPGRLDAFRGMHLPLPVGTEAERVSTGLRRTLAAHGF